ncbi:MAG: VWA domain-containing protein [Deltaproteobacteria bacterium]|nr:VWA domain-containing protein [Deltaproteobacteria bacterium]MBW2416940.1 VWA domain-containing protein [Deltaproteobacteria bacterium]
MSEFRFAAPDWIHALWAVLALVALLLYLEQRAGRALEGLVSPLLQNHLVEGPRPNQRRLRIVLLGLAGVFAVLALMRPQWGLEYVETPQTSAELMIAIDVSRSMLAEDVVPNRLERAKAEVRDLLAYLEGDQVGLIAFAGRASVLSPLTPDFGFIRLVLDELGPNSVGLGGTRLEEPVRKAVQGFRASGDISRVLLLITDGEDQDSFPLEAAKDAAERGIRIIAIGFGSERGSEIALTDPDTGSRMLLRDSDGRIVQSRLDGDTLREMALITGGVYVPAGTGVLDLESIYREHIAGLVRGQMDEGGRVLRSEAFQWPLLAALILLLGSALVGQGVGARAAVRAGGWLLALALAAAPVTARAQAPAAQEGKKPAAPVVESAAPVEEPAAPVVESAAPIEAPEPPVDGRVAYNDAGRELASDELDEAERLFEAAREAAGTDGELRFRATYGLGWVAARRADELLEGQPEQALNALSVGADYFREASRLRPADEDSRHNLEVLLQRVRVLADTLARRDEKDIAARLDELIVRQREQLSSVRVSLERVADTEDESPHLDAAARQQLRGLSTNQRLILSDADAFAQRIDGERRAIEEMAEEERTPEDEMSMVQLDRVQQYLHRGRERMGHSRRALRRGRSERAGRRASAALSELKWARDQLRNPVEVLDALLADEIELARQTQVLYMAGTMLPGAAEAAEDMPWLSAELLKESQEGVAGRTGELHERMAAGVAQPPPSEAASPDAMAEARERERFLTALREAEPLVALGAEALGTAGVSFETGELAEALAAQAEGIQALADARERFLELRGVIEAAYAEQRRIQSVLGAVDESAEAGEEAARSTAAQVLEFVPALREGQEKNLARSERLTRLLDEEREGLAGAEAAEPEDPEALEQERERLDLAEGILALSHSAMLGVLEGLEEPPAGEPAGEPLGEPWRAAIEPGEQAVRGLENLRRLFFSIVEHLQDTARRQQELGDLTEELSALQDDDLEARKSGLGLRQSALSEVAGSLAAALEEQSRQSPGAMVSPDPAAGPGGPRTPDAAAHAEEAKQLRMAAEHTLAAQIAMEEAAEGFAPDAPAVNEVRGRQDEALQALLEAIAALTPPQERGEQEEEQPQDENAEPQGQQSDEQEQQGEENQSQAGDALAEEESANQADPSQLLQEVRDREAERRRERAKKGHRGYETVERDW